MQKYKAGLFLLLAFIVGAVAMDYYIYNRSKNKGYDKIAGLFKYTAKPLV